MSSMLYVGTVGAGIVTGAADRSELAADYKSAAMELLSHCRDRGWSPVMAFGVFDGDQNLVLILTPVSIDDAEFRVVESSNIVASFDLV